MRLQPAAKARTPGAKAASCQPGIESNGACWYLASAGRVGAGQAWHSVQAGHAAAEEGCGGSSAQPAKTRIAAAGNAKVRRMWVIYLEMGVALALLILIVWWTWPAKRRPETPKDEKRKE